ncbi:MAG: TetR/AcrR family transcriptional regulator [Acidobacteriota bacterium]
MKTKKVYKVSKYNQHKEKILELSQEILFKKGYSGLKVDELAKELSMSKKTIYKIFASKEEIVKNMIKRFLIRIDREVSHIVKSYDDPLQRLQQIIYYMGNELSKIEKPYFDLKKVLPSLWKETEDFREKKFKYLHDILKEGKEKGWIRNDVNLEIALLMYIGAVRYVTDPEVVLNQSFSLKEIVENVIKIFFEGILSNGVRINKYRERN